MIKRCMIENFNTNEIVANWKEREIDFKDWEYMNTHSIGFNKFMEFYKHKEKDYILSFVR